MRKSILILIIVVLHSGSIFGQENSISLGVGYPINMTNHYLVEKWEKPINIDLRYIHVDKFLIGGGLKYSKYNMSWYRYYYISGNNNTISNIAPYLLFGLNIEKNIIALMPHIDLGYSALFTNNEIYIGGKGGFYSAVGVDCNFNINQRIQLGLGVNYNMVFNELDFEYISVLQPIRTRDKIMKSFCLNFNVAYRF